MFRPGRSRVSSIRRTRRVGSDKSASSSRGCRPRAQSPLGAARGCRGWACQRLCAANNFDQSVPRGRICRQQILCTGVNCPCGTGASAADPAPTTSHRVAAWILNRRWIPPHRRRRKNRIICASKGPEAVLEGLSWPIGRSVADTGATGHLRGEVNATSGRPRGGTSERAHAVTTPAVAPGQPADAEDETSLPRFTVGAVAVRLEVPIATLRSWNHRYGVGPPRHLPGRIGSTARPTSR